MLDLVWDVLYLVVLVYLVLLLARLVLDWVQVFARDWRPRGAVLVIAEVVYTATDPPINAVRRVVKPITIGQIRLDLAFTIVVLACWILLRVLAFL
ncbi:YggT family protein [Actinotalea solisilvae]|uniref:YggT family protein n=1 Tax=Actinotalea solisilvae TaxID=2072922 RepID=UPI0027DE5FF4|nr:YggT family protein [Actinotalea solisilvae]